MINKNKKEPLDDDSVTGVKSVDKGIFDIMFQIVFYAGFFIVAGLWIKAKIPFWIALAVVFLLIVLPLYIYRYVSNRKKISPSTKLLLSLTYFGFFVFTAIVLTMNL